MKQIRDFNVVENRNIHRMYSLLRLSPADGQTLPAIKPGQFVQVAVPGSQTTFLRRPISINFVDTSANEIWLLVRRAGEGTARLMELDSTDVLNLILPLGNGFSFPEDKSARILLVGGGVGVAPLLEFGHQLKGQGYRPSFLLGARTKADLLQTDLFSNLGDVFISTDDGSAGTPGVVTLNPVIDTLWDYIYCCGPAPMMKAVGAKARSLGIECEVSLENMMACGIGACLCCVERTVKGNICICTEGPVFNINQLTW